MLLSAAGGNISTIPFYTAGSGISTPFGIQLPPGSQVACYLRSTGLQTGDDQALAPMLVSTLASALQRVRAGMGDTIIALPGHSESGVGTTMLANMVSGTKIWGIPCGALTPTFRWTATTDNWAWSASNCLIQGLRLRMEGANGVVQAINVTGADNVFAFNEIEVASGAALKATIAMEVSNASAARFKVIGNYWRGTNTHNVTNGLLISAAVDQLQILQNLMLFSATAANGCINVTAAATNVAIGDNRIYNTMTASTAALNVGNVAADGMIWNTYVGILTNGVASTTGIVLGAASLFKGFQSFVSDEPNHSGVLNPIVVAT